MASLPNLSGSNSNLVCTSNITLDTFVTKDFVVKDFIENLTKSALSSTSSGRGGPPHHGTGDDVFDAKPLIRTFESALTRLQSLSEDLDAQENELRTNVRRAEVQHNQNVTGLSKKLNKAINDFNELENSLHTSSEIMSNPNKSSRDDGKSGLPGLDSNESDAVRLGEVLQEMDKQRQRAQDAKCLIQYWQEVSVTGSLSSLENMRRMGGSENKVRCATIARQLLRICAQLEKKDESRKLNNSGRSSQQGIHDQTHKSDKPSPREVIEKYLEKLEKDLLRQFDEFYRKQNFAGMRECATALQDFNDGNSVISLFVNQHGFFIDCSLLIGDDDSEILNDQSMWARLADPDDESPGINTSLKALIDEVRVVIQDESTIIKQAFPNSEEVLSRFIQRIFQQSIQQKVERVLSKADTISSLAFLRSYQSARSYVESLIEGLKSHGLIEHPEPVSPHIATVLDQQLEELFIPYFSGSTYIEREKKNLEELYLSLLFKFTTYNTTKRKKLPTGYLAALGQRSKEFLTSARDTYLEQLESADLPASQKAILLRIAGFKDSDGDKKDDIEVYEEDSHLNLDYAKRMIKWLAEGVGRGIELSGGNEVPKDVQALFNLLLTHMSDNYVQTALDGILEAAQSQDIGKTEPYLGYMTMLYTATKILKLLEQTAVTMIIPLALPNVTVRRDLETSVKAHTANMESKISLVLHRTLDIVLGYVEKLLQGQKKSDFRPKNDDELSQYLDALQTPTCAAVYGFLSKVARIMMDALNGGNVRMFFHELAMGVRGLLFEHLRRFTVSLAGGLVVSKDVNKYAELVGTWPIDTESKFAQSGGMSTLVDVANFFVVGPDALRDRLKPGAGGSGRSKEEIVELRRFVERREDSSTPVVQSILNGVNV